MATASDGWMMPSEDKSCREWGPHDPETVHSILSLASTRQQVIVIKAYQEVDLRALRPVQLRGRVLRKQLIGICYILRPISVVSQVKEYRQVSWVSSGLPASFTRSRTYFLLARTLAAASCRIIVVLDPESNIAMSLTPLIVTSTMAQSMSSPSTEVQAKLTMAGFLDLWRSLW